MEKTFLLKCSHFITTVSMYQLSHCGEVSVAVQDWWELVCALNPTLWIPEFADNAENLYDIIRTWGDDDRLFADGEIFWKGTSKKPMIHEKERVF